MNWAWLDGKMSIEHYEHEHPLDLVAIEKAKGSEEEAELVETKDRAEPVGSRK